MNIPTSSFIIWASEDIDVNLISDQFDFKVISSKGEIFYLLTLNNQTQITAEELSGKLHIDIQNIIPVNSVKSSIFDQIFFITGFNQDFLKFNEFKAILQQLSPQIRVFDNISAIEVNTEKCLEKDLNLLYIFLPVLFPSLIYSSDLPSNVIRLFVERKKNQQNPVTRNVIISLFKWEDLISQIYFNSDKTIIDVVLNEEGEKNYQQFYQKKVISFNGYIFNVCKFASLKKIDKYKSLELKAEYFPSSFSLENAYELFSNYRHIYRIQIVSKNSQRKSVIIQFTSQKSYKMLLNQGTIRYKSEIVSIKPAHKIKGKDDHFLSKSDRQNNSIEKSETLKINRRSVHFIDDVSDEEKINNSNNDEKSDTASNENKVLLHATRCFVSDNDSDDEKSDTLKEKSFTLNGRHTSQGVVLISDNDDDSDNDITSLHQNKNEPQSSEDLSLSTNEEVSELNTYLNRPVVLKELFKSLSKSEKKTSYFIRDFIDDEDDGEYEEDKVKLNYRKNLTQNVVNKRKFMVLDSSIEDLGSDDSYTKSVEELNDSYSDSE